MIPKGIIQGVIRKLGVEVRRYPSCDTPAYHISKLAIDTVLDVGANRGQFALEIRKCGFKGRIISFEPLETEYRFLSNRRSKDAKWQVENYALGDLPSQLVLNAAKPGFSDFSSFLSPSEFGNQVFSSDHKAAEHLVTIKTLKEVWKSLSLSSQRIFLKTDTQGYDLKVLDGAGPYLENVMGIMIELSFRRLYDKQPQIEEILPFLRARGFLLHEVIKVAADWRTGELLESDGIFYRLNSQPA